MITMRSVLGYPLFVLLAAAAAIVPDPDDVALAQGFNCELLFHADSLPGDANDVSGYTDPNTGDEYAVLGTVLGTGVYNVTDPANAYLTGFIESGTVSNIWRDFANYRSYIYAGSEAVGAGVQIIDMSDPESPKLAATYDFGNGKSHTLTTDTLSARLYVNGTSSGMLILDISDPAAPKQLGTYATPYVHDCWARNDTVFAACIVVGRLIALDTSDPTAIDTLAAFSSERQSTHNAWPTADGNYLLVTDETRGGRLTSWDISELSDPLQVDAFTAEPNGDAHNIYIIDDVGYIAHYTKGLVIVDVSDPLRLRQIGFYDSFAGGGLYNGAWGAYPFTQSGNIYISDIESGLFVVSFNGARPGAIEGIVTEKGTGLPLEGVEVRLIEAELTTLTDATGYYRLDTAEGEQTLTASRFDLVPTAPAGVTVSANQTTTFNLTLLDNTAQVVLSETELLSTGPVAAGSIARIPLTIKNGGGGLLQFIARDPRVHDDPMDDAIDVLPSDAPPLDVTTVSVRTDDSLLFRVEVNGASIPDNAHAILFLDLDQDAKTGVFNPLAQFGFPVDHDIGAELVVNWDIEGHYLPDPQNPVPGAAVLFDAVEFLSSPGGATPIGTGGATFSGNSTTLGLDLLADLGDDGNLSAAGYVGIGTYDIPDFPVFPVNVDMVPNQGHFDIGPPKLNAPWARVEPDSGSLGRDDSTVVEVSIVAPPITIDRTFHGALLIESNALETPSIEVPIELVVDGTIPRVSLAILQNPILSSYLELVATASEPLAGVPTLALGGAAVALDGDPGADRPAFRASYELSGGGEVSVALTASDPAGNAFALSETFVSFKTASGRAVNAIGPGGSVTVSAAEDVIPAGTFLVLRELPGDGVEESALSPAVRVGPAALGLAAPLSIAIPIDRGRARGDAIDDAAVFRLGENGWQALASQVSSDGATMLAESDRLGTFQVRLGSGAAAPRLPERAILGPAAPNPASAGATIALTLARPGRVALEIFDVSGRRVRTLSRGHHPPGAQSFYWNGRNDRGERVAAGTYLYRLETPDGAQARKLTVIR